MSHGCCALPTRSVAQVHCRVPPGPHKHSVPAPCVLKKQAALQTPYLAGGAVSHELAGRACLGLAIALGILVAGAVRGLAHSALGLHNINTSGRGASACNRSVRARRAVVCEMTGERAGRPGRRRKQVTFVDTLPLLSCTVVCHTESVAQRLADNSLACREAAH